MIRYYPSNQGGSAYPALIAPGASGGTTSINPAQEAQLFAVDFITSAASGGVAPYTYTIRKSSDRGSAGAASIVLTCADIVDTNGTNIALDIVATDAVDQEAYTEIVVVLDDINGFCGL